MMKIGIRYYLMAMNFIENSLVLLDLEGLAGR